MTAATTVSAAFGLQPGDELILWGLLGLTLKQPDRSAELFATPHFMLRSLGIIDAASDRGGSAYRAFRESLKRLAGVIYSCDGFYDPIRREHRATTFGFLSYSLPSDLRSSRAWRIVWDPLFLEFFGDARGCLAFDMSIYRTLDAASRRLYLFLSKVFWRREWTHWLDVRSLAVDVLGFAPTVALRNLKQKVKRAIESLANHGLIKIRVGTTTRELFVDRDDGGCLVRLQRGWSPRRCLSRASAADLAQLPIYEPLRTIGLDDEAIGWVAGRFKHSLVQQWADITLAARERHGRSFFKKSPQAFFVDNIREATESGRTPPDWWWACKKEQEQAIVSPLARQLVAGCVSSGRGSDRTFLEYLKGDGRAEFEQVTRQALDDLCRGGMSREEAIKRATELSHDHLKRRFVQNRGS